MLFRSTVEHVTDPNQIMQMGVMATPGLVIDGKVVAMGRVLSTDQIIALINLSQKAKEPTEKVACGCGSDCCK